MNQATNRAAVESVADDFHIVYTPFHGAGHALIPEALRRLGFRHIHCVPEQMVIDGTFPTVKSPNPEDPAGFTLAIELAEQVGADFIVGSDPDADRVGIMIRDQNGQFVPVSGNRTGVMLLDYVISARKAAGTLPENPAILKTIVTTEMARKVAEMNGIPCYDTFTGFKFMAEKIKEFEADRSHSVIFSYEESYGYMIGDYVRDKDAVTASLLLCEMAAWYKSRGLTMQEALDALFEKYGGYAEQTVNLVMPGLDGREKMLDLMHSLRMEPLRSIGGVKVRRLKDFLNGMCLDLRSGYEIPMELSGSNVLRYELADRTALLIRPSGTEPKIKVYILTSGAPVSECESRLAPYAEFAASLCT